MTNLLPQDRAWRRPLIALALGTLFGFIITAAAGAYLVLRFIVPEEGWGSAAIPLFMSVTVVPLLLGCAIGAGLAWCVERWHYLRGYHRCIHCGRTLRTPGIPCVCVEEQFRTLGLRPVRRRSKWRSTLRHYRQHLPRFAAAFLIVLAIATLAAFAVRRPPLRPDVVDVLALDVVLSNILFLAGDLADLLLRRSRRWKCISLRNAILAQLLGIWSILGALALALVAARSR